MKMKFKTRPLVRAMALAMGLALAGCWLWSSPASLNKQIDEGHAATALTTIESKLKTNPEDPAYSLLAAKARMALCVAQQCTRNAQSSLLQPLAALLAHATAPVPLGKNIPPLLPAQVVSASVQAFATLPGQPAPMQTLYRAMPESFQPQAAAGLFLPALQAARKGQEVAALLAPLTAEDNPLPATYARAAAMLQGYFAEDPSLTEVNTIALRSAPATPALPTTAAALIPWALLTQAHAQGTPTSDVLNAMPQTLHEWKLVSLLTPQASGAISAELLHIAKTPEESAQWRQGWQASAGPLPLALKQTALALNPNQPDVWASYLPELVKAGTGTGADSLGSFILPSFATGIQVDPSLINQLISATTQLEAKPALAAPLALFTGRLKMASQQQVQVEKLVQDILLKAADKNDISTTILICRAQPGVALNNRQTVVPLLVNHIRDSLRAHQFDEATGTADLLTKTLHMDVEIPPIILQEFTDELARDHVKDALAATSPTMLLTPSSTVAMDLGPMFGFMQDYFKGQPKLISAQLTTLIAQATGPYGPATAMYRLGDLFPPDTMTADQRQQWLAASLSQALINDASYSGPAMASLAMRLSALHPGLNLPTLVENAINRTANNTEDQRQLWKEATVDERTIIKTIKPEFSALMEGIDAVAAGRLNAAVKLFATLTTPQWQHEAQPYVQQLQSRLIGIAGLYVPVSGAMDGTIAAIRLVPQGLSGGALNQVSASFISRLGAFTENQPQQLRTSGGVVRVITLPLTLDVDSFKLPVSQNDRDASARGGTFEETYGTVTGLALQPVKGHASAPTLLTLAMAGGKSVPFVRAVVGSEDPLMPNGAYLIQTLVKNPVSGTEGILPAGTIIAMQADDNLIPAPQEFDTQGKTVYLVSGTLNHPASNKPILFRGAYNPDTLTTSFTFQYPLSHSGQPVTAAARCQTLAGPIICAMHHTHSPRIAYATLSAGLETQESLAASTQARTESNRRAAARLASLADGMPAFASTASTTTADGLLPAPQLAGTTQPVSATRSTSPSDVSTTTPAAPSETAVTTPASPSAPAPTVSETTPPPSPTAESAPTSQPGGTLSVQEEAPATPSETAPQPPAPTPTTNTPQPTTGDGVPKGAFIHYTPKGKIVTP